MTYNQGSFKFKNGDKVMFNLDEVTFMPLMPAFHNASATAKALAMNGGILDDQNINLTALQNLMMKWHYKMGHLGFKHLQWFGHSGFFAPFGIKFGHKSVQVPPCAACLLGGQEETPIRGTTVVKRNQGVLKNEKLQPGDLVFTDQYVCSLEGQNFNNRGQTLRHQGFKGGIIFCDSASGFMYILHQVGFIAHETVESKLKFEREAAQVGVQVSAY